MGETCTTHGGDDTRFWLGNLKGRDHSEDLGIDGKIILEWIIERWGQKLSTALIWFRIGASGGLL
jgi:hypothetical protein